MSNGNCLPPGLINNCANQANLQYLPCRDASIDMLGREEAIIKYVNLLRENLSRADLINRPPLQPDEGLASGARYKANEMVQFNYFGHCFFGRNAIGLVNELRARGINILTNCIAENLHRFSSDPYEIFAGWFCSIGHFNNMINPEFDRIGVGYIPSSQLPDRDKWAMWLASSSNQNRFDCQSIPSLEWVQMDGYLYQHRNCTFTGYVWDGSGGILYFHNGTLWFRREIDNATNSFFWSSWNGVNWVRTSFVPPPL